MDGARTARRTRRSGRILMMMTPLAFALAQGANGATETWYSPRIPDIQANLLITFAALGLALLGWPTGMLLTSLFAGRLCDWVGTRKVYVAGCLCYWGPFPLIAFSHNAAEYFACLFAVGVGNACFDIPVNTMSTRHDADLRRRRKEERKPPPRTHNVAWGAVFSFVSVAAAFGGSVARQAHVGLLAAFLGLTLVAWLATLPFAPSLPDVKEPTKKAPPLPQEVRWRLRRLVVVAIVAGFPLGAVYAWSTTTLGQHGAKPVVAGLGLDLFGLCQGLTQMAIFSISNRVGRVKIIAGGGAVALVGVGLVVGTASLPSQITGFALIGIGLAATLQFCANEAEELSPVAQGRVQGRVTTATYGGLVGAQPVMGFLAQLVGLRFAWLSIGLCALTLLVVAPVAFQLKPDAGRRKCTTTFIHSPAVLFSERHGWPTVHTGKGEERVPINGAVLVAKRSDGRAICPPIAVRPDRWQRTPQLLRKRRPAPTAWPRLRLGRDRFKTQPIPGWNLIIGPGSPSMIEWREGQIVFIADGHGLITGEVTIEVWRRPGGGAGAHRHRATRHTAPGRRGHAAPGRHGHVAPVLPAAPPRDREGDT